MASPKQVLNVALLKKKENPEEEPAICEMIEKVFCTRNLVHFQHWATNSFAQHMALGELYDGIIDLVDDLTETYIGEFGQLSGLECCEAKMSGDIIATIKADADWIKANRDKIANGSKTIENMVDSLSGLYNKTLYKLNNLH